MAAPPLVTQLIELGADDADSAEDRLRKKVLVSSAIGVALLASVGVGRGVALRGDHPA